MFQLSLGKLTDDQSTLAVLGFVRRVEERLGGFLQYKDHADLYLEYVNAAQADLKHSDLKGRGKEERLPTLTALATAKIAGLEKGDEGWSTVSEEICSFILAVFRTSRDTQVAIRQSARPL
jgi:hypothetical protein